MRYQIEITKDITNVKDLPDPVEQAVELKSQMRTCEKLNKILSELTSLEMGEPLPKNRGNDYGV